LLHLFGSSILLYLIDDARSNKNQDSPRRFDCYVFAANIVNILRHKACCLFVTRFSVTRVLTRTHYCRTDCTACL